MTTENTFILIAYILVILAVVGVPVGLFNIKVYRAVCGTKPKGLVLVDAFIPATNLLFARKLVYGKTAYTYGLVACGVLILFRAVALALINTVPILIFYSGFAVMGCLALFIVLYVANAVSFCRLFNCKVVVTLCCLLIAPVGYYMLSTQVLGYFRNTEEELSGRFTASK